MILAAASTGRTYVDIGYDEKKQEQQPQRRLSRALDQFWARVRHLLAYVEVQRHVLFASAFAAHGSWISRHQTRTLLLCNLVIACLFYPAVVMYLLTTSEDAAAAPMTLACMERHRVEPGVVPACVSGAHAPNNIWDAARSSLTDMLGLGGIHRGDQDYPVRDLRFLWDETPSLEVVAPPKKLEHVPYVVMEQVLITTDAVRSGRGSPYGMLEPHALLTAQGIQTALDRMLGEPAENACGLTCVREHDSCLVLSPLDYWHSDADKVSDDCHPAKSYTGSPIRAVVTPPVASQAVNTTIPLLYSTTLASRWPFVPIFSRAEYLVLTYFLTPSSRDDVGGCWQRLVKRAAASVYSAEVTAPTHVAPGTTFLESRPQSQTKRPTLNYGVVAVGYIMLLLFIFRGLVQMRRLHSRFGIAFTGSVQLVLDLVMSLSVCALLGIRLTAVPWSILPFIIVVVGSESMLYMIRTVTNTPLSLTVHARIAYGLSQVAGPITLTALSDIVLLVLLASFVRIPSVSQFCLFAICTLVVDYFMQMTFFATVLSIDMQRLELAEVLLQGTAGTQTSTDAPTAQPALPHDYRPRSAASILMAGARMVWHTRAARSLRFSLVATAVLSTVFFFTSDQAVRYVQKMCAQWLGHAQDVPVLESMADSAYSAFWTAVNPTHEPVVGVRVMPWTLVSLARDGAPRDLAHTPPGPWLEGLFYHRRGATVFLVFLSVVGPIAGTMLIMSVVLRYLRKDADLLESQDEASHAGDAGLAQLLQNVPKRTDFKPLASLDVHIGARVEALHPAPLHTVVSTAHATFTLDLCNTICIERADAPVSLVSYATLRMDAGLAPDGARIAAMDAQLGADGNGVVVFGQVSGRVAAFALPTWTCLLDTVLGPDALAPVQYVSLRNVPNELVTFHRDGRLLAWHGAALAKADEALWTSTPRQDSYAQLLARLPQGVWTGIDVAHANVRGTWLGAVSTKGHLALFRLGASEEARRPKAAEPVASAERLFQVNAPALCRCAALFAEHDAEESSITPPRPHSPMPRRALPWLVAGDQQGCVHLWTQGSGAPTASLALRTPKPDGAVKRVQRLSGSAPLQVLFAATSNRVWFLGAHTEQDAGKGNGARLVLLGSVDNARGTADMVPCALEKEPDWVLGVRRAMYAGAARWEVWRMRVPHFSSVSLAPSARDGGALHVERVALPLEQLISRGVLQRLENALVAPPSRLPLLATRMDAMILLENAGGTCRWALPFGSILVTLDATYSR
ncbi:hypothetical protein MVES_003692 [Malassezia vespertilionis]|uniref:SSD domain-containing protein n=1 Tax=Malassezia vespertilionis TaxID=2020962 RepID=A0A2N1J7E4_9BASI|nr:hypothetical protein MVES_003692 [Malassezia vespertilionis]